jgi:hypothetical protein
MTITHVFLFPYVEKEANRRQSVLLLLLCLTSGYMIALNSVRDSASHCKC